MNAFTDTVRKFAALLDRRERRNALILLGLILVSGALDGIGVASILPFLDVLSDKQALQNKPYLLDAYEALGFASLYQFQVALGVGAFALVLLSLAAKALTLWALARFGHLRTYTISSRLLHAYLSRPYSFFLNRHTGDLGKSILGEVDQVVNQCLLPALRMVAHGVTALCLIAVMVWVQPLVAAVAVAALGLAYGGIYVLLRQFLARSGADRVQANQERFKVVQEAFGGIKELKVSGSEPAYLRAYRDPAHRFARHQASNQIAAVLPRFAVEAAGLGAALAVVLVFLASQPESLSAVVPVLGLYGFAGLRLLPALQEVYRGFSMLRFGMPALDALYSDYVEDRGSDSRRGPPGIQSPPPPLALRDRLEFRNVSFAFTGSGHSIPALRGIDVEIPAGQVTGIVGATGAGKSTLVDVMLGLLRPTEGEIRIDGQALSEDLIPAWQRSIGYVPQHIFLADESVAANIAFGVPDAAVDREAVARAARQAQIHDFIVTELPHGYDTTVGERGIRLSGGQKQRIGIARALYHDPSTLILDEATSALDNHTERAVMDAMHRFGSAKTIVLIAHRLASVQSCDRLLLLDQGTLRATGSYSELAEYDKLFRSMKQLD